AAQVLEDEEEDLHTNRLRLKGQVARVRVAASAVPLPYFAGTGRKLTRSNERRLELSSPSIWTTAISERGSAGSRLATRGRTRSAAGRPGPKRLSAATQRRHPESILEQPEILFDLDTPEDCARLLARCAATPPDLVAG